MADDGPRVEMGEPNPDADVPVAQAQGESDGDAGSADERKSWRALTPDEKKERRQEWRALRPQERRERVSEITQAAERKRMMSKGIVFSGLGVRVRDGEIYPYPTLGQPALGPADGARAEITDPTKAQMVGAGLASGVALGSLLGPIALAPALLRKSKAVAFVVCANGRFHEKKLDGTATIRAAQRDAVKLNALLGSASTSTSALPTSPTPRERLAELASLREDGLLTEEEYQAKRTEIISQL